MMYIPQNGDKIYVKNQPLAKFIQASHDDNSHVKALNAWCSHRTVQVNVVVDRQWILQATQKTSKGRSGQWVM